MTKKWDPIIHSSKKKEIIIKKINEITACIDGEYLKTKNAGLLDGRAGLAIYYGYLNLYEKSNNHNKKIDELLGSCFDSINDGLSNPSFGSGIAGILWSIYHLNVQNIIETDIFFDEIMPYLENQMINHSADNNFDFLHGSCGIALYLLNFHEKIDNKKMNILIEYLKQNGIIENNMISWKSSLDIQNPKKVFNLSLSHGISSIIIILCKFLIKYPDNNECRTLLNQSVSFLISKKHSSSKKMNSIFPSFVDDTNNSDESRMAWCYGDLGNALALYEAGIILNRKDLVDFSIEIISKSVKRKNLKDNLINDAEICHGTAGLSLIFNQYYQITKKKEFKTAALYWLDETLNMAKFEDGLAGYKTLKGDHGWENSTGILEGIAGIGLVLMSSIDNIEPKWDKCLLIS